MRYREFGSENAESIILLHGGAMSWWNYRAEAEMLKGDYHVIIPFLDGHAGSDRPFSSIESNAQEIIAFINERLNGSVLLIGGLSLGGQILLEMLSQRGDICRHALVESAMVIPSPITGALIRPAFGSSYFLIRQRWFAGMQFRQYHIKAEFFEDYYRDTCAVRREDMIAFLRANTAYSLKDNIKNCSAGVHIYYGEKETRGIKKSAQLICSAIPSCTAAELPGMYHGGLSFNHPGDYVKIIRDICRVGEIQACRL